MTLIVLVMQMIPLPTIVDKIFLKNVINVFKSLHENGLKNIKVNACDGPAALLKKRFYDT